jgi:hypothetical protein
MCSNNIQLMQVESGPYVSNSDVKLIVWRHYPKQRKGSFSGIRYCHLYQTNLPTGEHSFLLCKLHCLAFRWHLLSSCQPSEHKFELLFVFSALGILLNIGIVPWQHSLS